MFERVGLAEVRERQTSLTALVAALDPDDVGLAEAPAMWKAFDTIERLAASAKTLLARRVEDSRVWRRKGHRSAAEHLASEAGTSVSAARSELDASRRVQQLPEVEAAVRRGALSKAQSEAIADAAAADPASEERLLHTAERSSLLELRDECRRTKAAADPDPDATHRRIHTQRRLREYTDAEGAWNLHARGPVEAGAKVRAAPGADHRADLRGPPPSRRARAA